MPNQQLIDYIKKRLEEGRNKEDIKKVLMDNGWPERDLEEAFNAVSASVGIEPPLPSLDGRQSFPSEVQPSSAPAGQPSASAAVFPGAFALLKDAWAIYKQRPGTFLGITAIPMIIPAILVVAAIILFPVIAGAYLFFSIKFVAENIILLITLVVAITIAVAVLQLWAQVSLLYAIKDSAEDIGIKESYRRGWRKILSYWWLTILTGIIVGGGMLLFAVPGIIFAVWFSLALYVLVAEDSRGINALLKSREYVRGKWWAVLWRMVFIFAFAAVIYLAASIFANALFIIIFQLALPLLLAPLAMAYYFLIYENLRAQKGEFVFAPTTKQKVTPLIIGVLGFLFIFGIAFWLSIGAGLNRCDLPLFKVLSSHCALIQTRDANIPSLQETFIRFELDNDVNLIGITGKGSREVLLNLADIFGEQRDLLVFPYKILPVKFVSANVFIAGRLASEGYDLGRFNILNIETKSVDKTQFLVNAAFDKYKLYYGKLPTISPDGFKIIVFKDVDCGDAEEIYIYNVIKNTFSRVDFRKGMNETTEGVAGLGCGSPDVRWGEDGGSLIINFYDMRNPDILRQPVRSLVVPVGSKSAELPTKRGVFSELGAKQRDSQRISDIKQIQLALELYFDANTSYPFSLSSLAPVYIQKLPVDPLAGSNYLYAPLAGQGQTRCSSYHLGAFLEDKENYYLKFIRKAAASPNVCNGFSGRDFDAGEPGTAIYDARP